MATPTLCTYTSVGLDLIAGAQIGGPSAQVTYVAIGTGAALLAGNGTLVTGQAYTQLPVNALPAGLPAGQQLVIVYETNTDLVTLAQAANAGDVTLTIESWTPAFAFPVGSGLVNQPASGDTQLQAETVRAGISGGTPGTGAGETLISGYCDPTSTPTGTYLEVGWFGGAGATSAANSGTLIARGVIWWPHSQGRDSATLQLDGTI